MAAIGEVLSSSITEMVVACWQQDDFDTKSPPVVPPFGSFLKVESTEQKMRIFAVVFNVLTGPQDGMHKPAALHMTREELRRQQPQIFSLLKTELQAAVIGFERSGHFSAGLGPLPAQVHDFVYPATAADISNVTESLEFIRLLTRVSSVPNDELVVSAIDEAYLARDSDYGFLVEAGQALAQSLGEDYNRLSAALTKLKARQSQPLA